MTTANELTASGKLHSSEIESKEQWAALLWTMGIVGFFLIQAVFWIFALYFTNNDLSHAVLPKYDSRALRWDEEARMLAASQQLGWKCKIEIAPSANLHGEREVTIHLTDASGHSITDAQIELSYFHVARVALRQTITLAGTESDQNVYSVTLPINRGGKWRFEIKAERGDDLFVTTQEQFVHTPSTR